jgi:ABC-type Fe3+-citrate transport system substrate-binding protein
MADLSVTELQRQLANVEDLLALLVDVSDERIPQLRKYIENIIGKIQYGIDVSKLKETVQSTINNSIETANYTKMLATAKEIKEAVSQATQTFKDYEKHVESISTWQTGIIAGVLSFVFGVAGMWAFQYNRIDKYQYAIEQTNAMSGYINSSCQIKQSYAKFVGQTIDCDTNWASPSSLLNRKK